MDVSAYKIEFFVSIDDIFFFFHIVYKKKKKNSRKIMSGLNPNAVYEELVSVRLVGMMLTIVVREELRKNVVGYSKQSVATGALNIMVILLIMKLK